MYMALYKCHNYYYYDLLASYNFASQHGMLSISQRRGIISLIPKNPRLNYSGKSKAHLTSESRLQDSHSSYSQENGKSLAKVYKS